MCSKCKGADQLHDYCTAAPLFFAYSKSRFSHDTAYLEIFRPNKAIFFWYVSGYLDINVEYRFYPLYVGIKEIYVFNMLFLKYFIEHC